MIARRIALLALLATGIAAGWYFALYLTRWEWNRAFVAALIFVAAEIAFFAALALERIGRIERRIERSLGRRHPPAEADPAVLARIQESAPEPSEPFRWLDPNDGRLGVFVPVLLGAGVVVSALAWVVERIARATATPKMEASLARKLGRLAPPPEPLAEATRRGRDAHAGSPFAPFLGARPPAS